MTTTKRQVTKRLKIETDHFDFPRDAEDHLSLEELQEKFGLADVPESGAGSATASCMLSPSYRRDRMQVFSSVTLPAALEDLLSGRASYVASVLAEQAAANAADRVLPYFVELIDGAAAGPQSPNPFGGKS